MVEKTKENTDAIKAEKALKYLILQELFNNPKKALDIVGDDEDKSERILENVFENALRNAQDKEAIRVSDNIASALLNSISNEIKDPKNEKRNGAIEPIRKTLIEQFGTQTSPQDKNLEESVNNKIKDLLKEIKTFEDRGKPINSEYNLANIIIAFNQLTINSNNKSEEKDDSGENLKITHLSIGEMISEMSWSGQTRVLKVLEKIELYIKQGYTQEEEKVFRSKAVPSLLGYFLDEIIYLFNNKIKNKANKIKYIKQTIKKIKEIIDIVYTLEEFKNNKDILELLNNIIERLEEILKELNNNDEEEEKGEDGEEKDPDPVPPKPVPPVPPEEESNLAYAWFLLKEDPDNPDKPLEPTVHNMNNALLIQGWRRCNENEDDVALVLDSKGEHKKIKELIENYRFVGLCVGNLDKNDRFLEGWRWAYKPFPEAIEKGGLRREFKEEVKERQKKEEELKETTKKFIEEEAKLGESDFRWENSDDLKNIENYLNALKELKKYCKIPLTDDEIIVLRNYIKVHREKNKEEYDKVQESLEKTFGCKAHKELSEKIAQRLNS